jgi:hypothetical protein
MNDRTFRVAVWCAVSSPEQASDDKAIEALGTNQPTGGFERATAALRLAAYKRRLRAITAAAPVWMAERILSASEAIPEDRPVVWMSEN